MTTALDALHRLRDGNARFASGRPNLDAAAYQARLTDLAQGQQPFAIVLGCSDSRVPVEITWPS